MEAKHTRYSKARQRFCVCNVHQKQPNLLNTERKKETETHKKKEIKKKIKELKKRKKCRKINAVA